MLRATRQWLRFSSHVIHDVSCAFLWHEPGAVRGKRMHEATLESSQV